MSDPATPDLVTTAAVAAARSGTEPELMDAVLPALRRRSASQGVAVISRPGRVVVRHGHDGIDPPVEMLPVLRPGPVRDADLPEGWPSTAEVVLHPLPTSGAWAVLVGPHTDTPHTGTADVEVLLALLDGNLARIDARTRLTDLTQRVDNAQMLAQMGDYDWHIATDVNTWSDQLYRIYGYEPQSFNASYERFISLIHPDDRERIQEVHQGAYATGGGYQMVERIVRPDGEVRYLASNGEVVTDDDGTPVRMRGTCIDITPTVVAERERELSTARFESLVESSPDAMMLLAEDGAVIQANSRTGLLLGTEPVGRHLSDVLGTAWADVMAFDHTSATPQVVQVDGADGTPLSLDVSLTRLSGRGQDGEDQARFALFLRDARPRLDSEALTLKLREAEVSRKQALEINDNVVQGITSGLYALDQDNPRAATVYLQRTLSAARQMMHDLLAPLDGADLEPGDLVRLEPSGAARTTTDADWAAAPPPVDDAGPDVRRVLLADDSADVRLLLNCMLQTMSGYEVAGEAADGVEAVEMAGALRPDLVLLDLAMPRMDGLQAIPLIREVVPGARIIVLSGFDGELMGGKAVAAGADGYVEKGHAMGDLQAAIEGIVGPVGAAGQAG